MTNLFLAISRFFLFLLVCQAVIVMPNVVQAQATDNVEKPINVFVSILPQKYFVERIAGEYAVVDVMVGPGQSPETYDPSPKQLAKVSKADIYFSIGVPFEKVWMSHIRTINRDFLVVETSHEETDDHQHEHEEHGDPHVWTNPEKVALLADQILQALVRSDPARENNYRKNHSEFKKDLAKLDQELDTKLANWAGSGVFLVMHPAWGDFAERYQLEQIAIEHEGKSPGAKSLQKLIRRAKEENIKVVFIQDQHSSHMAKTVAEEIGAKVVRLDPLALNYFDNMRKVTDAFLESFELGSQK